MITVLPQVIEQVKATCPDMTKTDAQMTGARFGLCLCGRAFGVAWVGRVAGGAGSDAFSWLTAHILIQSHTPQT